MTFDVTELYCISLKIESTSEIIRPIILQQSYYYFVDNYIFEQKNHTLHLVKTTPDDFGEYICTARNLMRPTGGRDIQETGIAVTNILVHCKFKMIIL